MQKPAPVYSLELVLHPERDLAYQHFEYAQANPFEPNAADLSRVNAWWLAEAALLAYWKDALPIFQAAGFQAEFVSAHGTDCYVAAQKDFVVVAFRGTQPDDWRDVLSDANIVLAPWQDGMVHLGFRRAFEVIRPGLDPILQRLTPGRTVWFCGHSLGAALATLAADHYGAAGGVCTVGSPRVGDAAFVRAFNARLSGRSARYINSRDVVTHLPAPIGYQHVDARRFIAADGSISAGEPAAPHVFADLIDNTRALLDGVEGWSKGMRLAAPQFLLDHMPKAYAVWTWNDYDAHR
jgi:hypothetical protein